MTKMMKGSLTPEQLEMIYIVRQEYIDILTKDFDDDDVIKKVKWFYKLHGLREPHVHIFDSPHQFQYIKIRYDRNSEYPHPLVGDNIYKDLFRIWKQLQKSIDESTIDLIKRELVQKIHGLYEDHNFLEIIVRRVILNGGFDMGRGHNIPLLSLYDYFLRIGAIKDTSRDKNVEKFISYMRTGIRYRLYTHNHAYIIRNNNGPQFKDELGRFHNEKGFAVTWRIDKKGNIESGLHFIKGVYFDPGLFDKIFIKENITSEEILKIKNTEQKAVAIHHIGFDKFIKILHAKKLDTWTTKSVINGNIAVCKLYQFDLDGRMLRFVEVQDHSTGKKTVLGVPIEKGTETAKGAVAWTFGKKEKDYNPTIET